MDGGKKQGLQADRWVRARQIWSMISEHVAALWRALEVAQKRPDLKQELMNCMQPSLKIFYDPKLRQQMSSSSRRHNFFPPLLNNCCALNYLPRRFRETEIPNADIRRHNTQKQRGINAEKSKSQDFDHTGAPRRAVIPPQRLTLPLLAG